MKAMTKTAALVGAGVLRPLHSPPAGRATLWQRRRRAATPIRARARASSSVPRPHASNEIIAEIYAQVLENAGYDVERKFQIGQRDVYMPSLENGEIDVLPEYTGNLLQFLDDTGDRGAQPDDVDAELEDALPDGPEVLAYAPANDHDSYNVTSRVLRRQPGHQPRRPRRTRRGQSPSAATPETPGTPVRAERRGVDVRRRSRVRGDGRNHGGGAVGRHDPGRKRLHSRPAHRVRGPRAAGGPGRPVPSRRTSFRSRRPTSPPTSPRRSTRSALRSPARSSWR